MKYLSLDYLITIPQKEGKLHMVVSLRTVCNLAYDRRLFAQEAQ